MARALALAMVGRLGAVSDHLARPSRCTNVICCAGSQQRGTSAKTQAAPAVEQPEQQQLIRFECRTNAGWDEIGPSPCYTSPI